MRIFISILVIFMAGFSFAEEAVKTDKKPDIKKDVKDAIGKIRWTKGKVTATLPDKDKRKLKRRSDIFKFDTIASGPKGSAQVNFSDDSVLSLKPNTEMKIEDYKFDKKSPKKDTYVASIAKGGFRTITGQIAKRNPKGYKTKTPTTTIGVRGTKYGAVINPDGSAKVVATEGVLKVNLPNGKTVTVDASTAPNGLKISKDGQVTQMTKQESADFAAELSESTPVEPGSPDEPSKVGDESETTTDSTTESTTDESSAESSETDSTESESTESESTESESTESESSETESSETESTESTETESTSDESTDVDSGGGVYQGESDEITFCS